jgi:hypothetical protein
LAKENNSRPKEQNGRSKKIQLFDINNNFIEDFKYIGACAEYVKEHGYTKAEINSIRSNIANSIKTNKPYLKKYYKFVS